MLKKYVFRAGEQAFRSATVQFNARIDPALKKGGDSVLARNKVPPSEAVRALLDYLTRMMRNRFDDFEDNLIVAAANTANVDYIVTSDRKMLEHMPEACITPKRALDKTGNPAGEFRRRL